MGSHACCTAGPPLTHDYTPIGTTRTLENGLEVYVTGSGSTAVLTCYDIFGAAFKQVYQVADRIAAAGFTVAVPDVFRGNAWKKSEWPPKSMDDFFSWIKTEGAWHGKLEDDFAAVRKHLTETKGCTRFAALGVCWGSLIAMEQAAAGLVECVAGAHPTHLGKDVELAEKINCPVALLPAQGDDISAMKQILDKKPFADKCVFHHFEDQVHGFMAARGYWEKPEVAAAAAKATDILADFFKANLQQQ